jgi:hypothetical protein
MKQSDWIKTEGAAKLVSLLTVRQTDYIAYGVNSHTEYRAKGRYGRRGWPSSRGPYFGLSCSLRYLQVTSVWTQSSSDPNTVEHLICIGDPQQLRPNVSTFSESPAFFVMQN